MICKVKDTLRKFSMTEDCEEIIVGFSGGADSVCLLYILNSLKNEFNFTIHAAHVNHCLRGEESERDETFVRDFCRKHSIRLSVIRRDVLNEAKLRGKGVEEYARELRYEFFESLSSSVSRIATAHNLNDCEETMIFNLTRGSALKGLCSIPAVRGKIIRPLIECSRDEIEAFCEKNSLQFVTDSTNLSDDYTRNKIRHNIIPLLKEINPSFDSAAFRCISSLRDDERYLNEQTDALYNKALLDFGFDAKIINEADIALKNRVISRIIFEKCSSLPERKHIELVSSILDGGKAEILTGEYVIVKHSVLYFSSDIANSVIPEKEVIFDDNGIWQDCRLRLEIKNECTQNVYKELVLSTFDCDKIKGKLILRNRHEGDRITLPLRKVTKSLKKLFNEMKILPEERDNILILADDENVVWVEKIGVDMKFLPDKNTKHFVNIEVMCNNNIQNKRNLN